MTSTQLSFLLFGLFVLAMFVWHLVDEYVRPMFIPRSEINALADEMIAKHGDRAEEMAYIEEDRAWRYSEIVEQGKWRRVKREIEHRRTCN